MKNSQRHLEDSTVGTDTVGRMSVNTQVSNESLVTKSQKTKALYLCLEGQKESMSEH